MLPAVPAKTEGNGFRPALPDSLAKDGLPLGMAGEGNAAALAAPAGAVDGFEPNCGFGFAGGRFPAGGRGGVEACRLVTMTGWGSGWLASFCWRRAATCSSNTSPRASEAAIASRSSALKASAWTSGERQYHSWLPSRFPPHSPAANAS